MAGELLQKSKAFPCHESSRHTHVDFYGESLTFEIGHDMDGKWSGKSN